MSFDEHDLRRGMDVFSADNVYLGTVVHIVRRAANGESPAAAASDRSGRSRAAPTAAFTGEALGPMPTATLGNRGPGHQSAASERPSAPTGGGMHAQKRPAELIVLRSLVTLDPSTLSPRLRRVPVSQVQLVSLERIVLSATEAELG